MLQKERRGDEESIVMTVRPNIELAPHADVHLGQCSRICLLITPTARSSRGVLSEVGRNERTLRILRACRQRGRNSPRPAAHHSYCCHRKHMTARNAICTHLGSGGPMGFVCGRGGGGGPYSRGLLLGAGARAGAGPSSWKGGAGTIFVDSARAYA